MRIPYGVRSVDHTIYRNAASITQTKASTRDTSVLVVVVGHHLPTLRTQWNNANHY